VEEARADADKRFEAKEYRSDDMWVRVFADSSLYCTLMGRPDFRCARVRPASGSASIIEQQADQRPNPGWSGCCHLARHVAGRRWARFVPFLLLRVHIRPVDFCFLEGENFTSGAN
jgi:hypothetical protein